MAINLGYRSILVLALLASCAFATGAAFALGDDDDDAPNPAINGRFCTGTSRAMLRSCTFEVKDGFWKASAVCLNVADAAGRAQCYAAAKSTRQEGLQSCRARLNWRLEACKVLGEGRYDPEFNPANFDTDFSNLSNPNPYFPLKIGNVWEFAGGSETSKLRVLDRTKQIDGVTCIVLRDTVFVDGKVKEDTDDWYAQNKDRNVWYCGEEVKDYDTFDGDKPAAPELVKIDGSFKAGRDGDKPGIIFLASPTAGQAYLEEFSLGNAEDVTQVLAHNYAYGKNAELDRYVPRKLAELLCRANDCVVTQNISLLEPGVIARKYYARGIGGFLEVKPANGEIVQLTNCNFDTRCANLPQP